MKNRNVGWLIIGISAFVFAMIWIFNYGVANILNATCSMGPTCSMYKTLNIQTWISLAIASIIFLIGLFLVLAKENEKIIIKKIKPSLSLEPKEFDKKSLKNLDNEEKEIMNLILDNKGSIFQSEIVDKTELGKVRVTRILDSLEAQGLVERKRRGMTNIVMLKRN
jgi:uncharacterized membrane protein